MTGKWVTPWLHTKDWSKVVFNVLEIWTVVNKCIVSELFASYRALEQGGSTLYSDTLVHSSVLHVVHLSITCRHLYAISGIPPEKYIVFIVSLFYAIWTTKKLQVLTWIPLHYDTHEIYWLQDINYNLPKSPRRSHGFSWPSTLAGTHAHYDDVAHDLRVAKSFVNRNTITGCWTVIGIMTYAKRITPKRWGFDNISGDPRGNDASLLQKTWRVLTGQSCGLKYFCKVCCQTSSKCSEYTIFSRRVEILPCRPIFFLDHDLIFCSYNS